MTTPLTRNFQADTDVEGTANVATETTIVSAPYAGALTAAAYIPEAPITGAAATKTLQIVNRGQAGVGTTVMASLSLVGGVNCVAYDAKALTLSVVAGATTVVEGDVIVWQPAVVGAGIALPVGKVEITLAKTGAS